MVLVHGFPKIAAFLLVPPIAVRITELTLFRGWIDVTAVHAGVFDVGLGDASDLCLSRDGTGFADEVWYWTDCGE